MTRKLAIPTAWLAIILLMSGCGHRERMTFHGPALSMDRPFTFVGGLETIGDVWYKVNFATHAINRELQDKERGQFKQFKASDFIGGATIHDRETIHTLGKHAGNGEIVTVKGDNAKLSMHFTFETVIDGRPWLISGQVQEVTDQATRLVMQAIRDDLEVGP